ncbi:protein wntless [Parasteatoda tepidariorum]|uniref:protein wntless n=1 Tax=Parasteatoda tepidariorum TaxID=114398 RepID=UPI00077FC571|nr:protein wntless [Parasteatoda tepidariorum]
MAGTILENLSGRKLGYLVSGLLLCQIICFLIGGLIAPAPSNAENMLATKCLMQQPLSIKQFDEVWHIPRGSKMESVNCKILNDLDLDSPDIINDPNITPNHIVFAFQTPLPKNGITLDYSRWMMTMNALLVLDILFMKQNPMTKNPKITFDVKLGYRNKWDPDDKWQLLANSTETRELKCSIDDDKKTDGYHYDCDVLPLFELGSVHHDYYLINIRVPIDFSGKTSLNEGIGHVDDMWTVIIHQNGGFTKVWVSLKTVFFPVILLVLIWYWKRICLLCRAPILVERMLLFLGISLSLLNLPLEYLSLWIDMPFMLLFSDIRQGIFYASLLSFWLVFCGEHLMDDVERNKLRSYWHYLTSVAVGCFCLFIFDMCERGVQLKNPFFSIWTSTVGSKLSLAFIILAGLSAGVYFLFLCYLVFKVFKNIGFKRNTLPSMSSARRMYYEGIIYRFKFLMLTTVICAALTVISFIIGQVSEGQWKWDKDIRMEYTSAFFTGVYGMWNLYTIALLALYAPSHKYYPAQSDAVSSTQEEIEFSRLTTSEPSPSEPTEISSLTGLAKKAAFD